MQTHIRPPVHLAFLLGALLFGAACAAPAGDPSSTAQIYQQRGADGRILLTDRPSPTAVTERTWKMDREDPGAAQQRALEVRREAQAVSERIQRRLDAEQRSAAEYDLERMRLAQRERELQLGHADDELAGAPVVFAPFPLRPFAPRRATGFEHRHTMHRPSRSGSRERFPRAPALL